MERLFIMGEMNLAMVDTHTKMTVMKAGATLMHLPSRTLAFTVSVCRGLAPCWWSSSFEMRVWLGTPGLPVGERESEDQTLSGQHGSMSQDVHRAAPLRMLLLGQLHTC